MPPAVQNLNDIIGSITAAQAPEQAQIDQNIQDNDTSGTAATAGLGAAKDAAFGKIQQDASNRGELFSGFSPDAQATYTGSTYLPALAKLQQTIEGTKNTLLGQKAALTTQANTQALSTQQDEQKELDAYNSQQEQEAQARTLQAEAEAAAAKEGALNRSAAASAAQSKAANALGSVTKNKVGGYNFFDANGNPITASAYANLNKTTIANVLQGSADKGDQAFINDYTKLEGAVSQGSVTAAQATAALKADYPNQMGNGSI